VDKSGFSVIAMALTEGVRLPYGLPSVTGCQPLASCIDVRLLGNKKARADAAWRFLNPAAD
jgi:hypothetical protein